MQKQIDESVYRKLEKIEGEIQDLKLLLLGQLKEKNVVPLGGAMKGVKVEEQEIKEAKRSLFKASV